MPAQLQLQAGKGGSILMRGGGGSDVAQDEAFGSNASSREIVAWKPGQQVLYPPRGPAGGSSTVLDAGDGGNTVGIQFGYKSLQGLTPGAAKPNQDALVIEPSLSPFWKGDGEECPKGTFLAGVFDGHGPQGEHASMFVRSQFAARLVADPAFTGDPLQAMRNAYHSIHADFLRTPRSTGVNAGLSGTTCVTVCIIGRKLFIANLGDSRAVLGRMSSKKESMRAVALSNDHTPDNPGERERVQRAGGVVRTEEELRHGGNPKKLYLVKERADGQGLEFGVMFTRSVGDGDSHAALGVIEDPEVIVRSLDERDVCIVLASDGVWDYFDNKEIIRIVRQHSDPQSAADDIVKRAKHEWDTKDQDGRRDDITAVVLLFNHQQEQGGEGGDDRVKEA